MPKWKHTVKFIGQIEARYLKEEITLEEMALEIMKRFYRTGWICENPEYEEWNTNRAKKGIDEEELNALETLIYEDLHSIAFAKDIYTPNEDDYPTIETYDYWKSRLYDWANFNKVWIEPSSAYC
jgi:hypothetical protein